MEIDEQLLKNVLFIGIEERKTFVPKATAFVVGLEIEKIPFLYLVTAEHVISGLLTRGHKEALLRLNMKDGSAQLFRTDLSVWSFHPESDTKPTDVAVAAFTPGDLPIDWIALDQGLLMTDEALKREEVGVGDQVFLVGLFRSHFGKLKNVPIVRTGNISAMLTEPIFTSYCGFMDGYLIEARSIAGLSGSPVYWHSPVVRSQNDQILYRKGTRALLLGLMHGHFDVKNLTEDVVTDDAADSGNGINTGIGVVVPAQKILETINQPEFQRGRENTLKNLKQRGAISDLADAETAPPTKPDIPPTDAERFTALVDAAARKKPRAD